MGKRIISLFLVTALLLVGSFNHVFATISEDLEPQEVVDRANVIVLGKYNFSGKKIYNERTAPYCGIEFNIDKIYKGNISDTEHITAGLDCNNGTLVEKFQQDGGKVLLFMDNSGKPQFLTPVGGSNGLVKIKNGEVKDEDEERRKFFKEFLEENNNDPSSFYIIVSIIFGLALIVILYYFKQRKKKKE
ncbi:hypothetical protein [Virgibacillus doumboii]|uniref:hypothetical protein n=1 Tax=Virgibacillus doumboii TaxID=2697503 RepID=UPI0013E0A93A|nr:hypothetical protein [Virgibacillus doumboii]